MNKKVLYVIIGAVSIVLGVICFFNTDVAILLSGIGLLVYGIGGFLQWRERKKAGAASGWSLITTILPIAFGAFILIGSGLGLVAAHLILIFLSIWLMAEGVFEVLGAVMYRKAMTTADLGVQAPGSVSGIVLGVIMVVVGILGLVSPYFAAFLVWIWLVCVLILTGIRLIWSARTAGVLEESN